MPLKTTAHGPYEVSGLTVEINVAERSDGRFNYDYSIFADKQLLGGGSGEEGSPSDLEAQVEAMGAAMERIDRLHRFRSLAIRNKHGHQ